VPEEPIAGRGRRRGVRGTYNRGRLRAWQARLIDPSLTVLLGLLLCAAFVAEPLAARGLSIARNLAYTLALAAMVIVIMLSQRRGAIISIMAAAAVIGASFVFGAGWPRPAADAVRRVGDMIAWSALVWVVGHAVYAPGRITTHRLQGAVVVYLAAAMIFASAYGLISELTPGAFADLHAALGGEAETEELLYFSIATLTTTGYGDIVAIDPFARSLANFESVLGVFYIGITVARLVTLEIADRRR
jgi:Ion channel